MPLVWSYKNNGNKLTIEYKEENSHLIIFNGKRCFLENCNLNRLSKVISGVLNDPKIKFSKILGTNLLYLEK